MFMSVDARFSQKGRVTSKQAAAAVAVATPHANEALQDRTLLLLLLPATSVLLSRRIIGDEQHLGPCGASPTRGGDSEPTETHQLSLKVQLLKPVFEKIPKHTWGIITTRNNFFL